MKALSVDAARALTLAAMGLAEPPARRATKRTVRDAIRRMGALQIDTIHVVARSPYLVLWSRLGDYQQRWLDELLADRTLFEYWSHAACFLPIEDYPLYRRLMLEKHTWHEHRWRPWFEAHADLIEGLLTHMRENGAV